MRRVYSRSQVNAAGRSGRPAVMAMGDRNTTRSVLPPLRRPFAGKTWGTNMSSAAPISKPFRNTRQQVSSPSNSISASSHASGASNSRS